MFIYILNLLNDGIRKQNKYKFSNIEIISDAKYISKLTGIKKNCDFENFSNRVTEIFELLSKYNLSVKDSIEILNKLILNENNSWILENIYKKKYENTKIKSEFVFSSVINSILEKNKFKKDYIKVNHKSLRINNIEKMNDYYIKFRGYEDFTKISEHMVTPAAKKEKVYALATENRDAGL